MALFLAFLVLTTLFGPTVTEFAFGRLLISFITFLTIVSGSFVTIQHAALKYLIVGLTTIAAIVNLLDELSLNHALVLLEAFLSLACLSALVLMTLKQTLRPGPVTIYRVLGGIAGYLLIGYTWAFVYQLLVQLAPGSIYFEAGLSANPPRQLNELIYFSFITLTTVGYGEVHPIFPAVRSLAVAEALVGQLYPAILIASLVGMAVQTRTAGRN